MNDEREADAKAHAERRREHRSIHQDVLDECDQIVGMLWVDLVNGDMLAKGCGAADAFERRRDQIREIANRLMRKSMS